MTLAYTRRIRLAPLADPHLEPADVFLDEIADDEGTDVGDDRRHHRGPIDPYRHLVGLQCDTALLMLVTCVIHQKLKSPRKIIVATS